MMENIRIYTADKYWNQIFTDLGMTVVASPNLADVEFDDTEFNKPVSFLDLQNIIFKCNDNFDILRKIFGKDVVLSNLQRKLVILLYKNPNMIMHDLKLALGMSPDIATHAVETAIYQLRKKYGRDFIINTNGKYKLGKL